MTESTEPKIGGNIDSWCIKCKLMLAHTIETIVDGKPKRTHCNTCKHAHVYRAFEPGTQKKARASAAAAKDKSTPKTKASDYATYMEGRDPATARRYSMSGAFVAGELMNHPKFGIGVTVALKDTTKIEVLFEDGPKVLVHNRA